MYRSKIDNAVTYTPDDIVLFRESPFAVWMERLTLENPDHGILPDIDSIEQQDTEDRQDVVATLRAEGRNVDLIDRELDETDRCSATLVAMRRGTDFIVNGHLAVDTLSGSANLLMRTSGYSKLGDFLYIPCETRAQNNFNSAFRLCFVADLLHGLQGQLPPQMLIIRDGTDVVPLQVEDYIYYYRAVQKRFMHAMSSFRKHRMPDPAESSHFGRWSECASEVLKQRALQEQHQIEEQQAEEAQEDAFEMPQLRVASGSATTPSHSGKDAVGLSGSNQGNSVRSAQLEKNGGARSESVQTLAEQARLLAPGSYRYGAAPGHTPNLARFGRPRPVAVPASPETAPKRRSADAALQNLEFIGSNATETLIGPEPSSELDDDGGSPAPAPSLRETPKREDRPVDPAVKLGPVAFPDMEPRVPLFLPPDNTPTVEPPPERLIVRPLDSDGIKFSEDSVVDMDSAPVPGLTPAGPGTKIEKEHRDGLQKPATKKTDAAPRKAVTDETDPLASTFSSSLITSEEIDDRYPDLA
jgi:hypothetical protein